VAKGADMQIPTYPVAVYSIHSKLINLTRIKEAKQRIILANTKTVPCIIQKIKRISWISKAYKSKARLLIIIEFTDPYTVNAFIKRGIVY